MFKVLGKTYSKAIFRMSFQYPLGILKNQLKLTWACESGKEQMKTSKRNNYNKHTRTHTRAHTRTHARTAHARTAHARTHARRTHARTPVAAEGVHHSWTFAGEHPQSVEQAQALSATAQRDIHQHKPKKKKEQRKLFR